MTTTKTHKYTEKREEYIQELYDRYHVEEDEISYASFRKILKRWDFYVLYDEWVESKFDPNYQPKIRRFRRMSDAKSRDSSPYINSLVVTTDVISYVNYLYLVHQIDKLNRMDEIFIYNHLLDFEIQHPKLLAKYKFQYQLAEGAELITSKDLVPF